MRRDLAEIVAFINDRRIDINLISNGSLISDAVVAQYRGMIKVWELPLLSHRREIHDRLGGGSFFDRVTYAVAAPKAAGQTVVVVFVATALNLGDFRQTAELALALETLAFGVASSRVVLMTNIMWAPPSARPIVAFAGIESPERWGSGRVDRSKVSVST
jgi:MoaA/NifB/PqqE/SkfB family radical SAM enzyme